MPCLTGTANNRSDLRPLKQRFICLSKDRIEYLSVEGLVTCSPHVLHSRDLIHRKSSRGKQLPTLERLFIASIPDLIDNCDHVWVFIRHGFEKLFLCDGESSPSLDLLLMVSQELTYLCPCYPVICL